MPTYAPVSIVNSMAGGASLSPYTGFCTPGCTLVLCISKFYGMGTNTSITDYYGATFSLVATYEQGSGYYGTEVWIATDVTSAVFSLTVIPGYGCAMADSTCTIFECEGPVVFDVGAGADIAAGYGHYAIVDSPTITTTETGDALIGIATSPYGYTPVLINSSPYWDGAGEYVFSSNHMDALPTGPHSASWRIWSPTGIGYVYLFAFASRYVPLPHVTSTKGLAMIT